MSKRSVYFSLYLRCSDTSDVSSGRRWLENNRLRVNFPVLPRVSDFPSFIVDQWFFVTINCKSMNYDVIFPELHSRIVKTDKKKVKHSDRSDYVAYVMMYSRTSLKHIYYFSVICFNFIILIVLKDNYRTRVLKYFKVRYRYCHHINFTMT